MNTLCLIDTHGVMQPVRAAAITKKADCAYPKGEFFMSHQRARLEIARMPLGNQARRVLTALEGALDYGNWLAIKPANLARIIDMDRSNFHTALQQLVKAGIVLRNEDTNSTKQYRLNPEFVWKGDGASHRKALTEQQRERMKRARITAVHTAA